MNCHFLHGTQAHYQNKRMVLERRVKHLSNEKIYPNIILFIHFVLLISFNVLYFFFFSQRATEKANDQLSATVPRGRTSSAGQLRVKKKGQRTRFVLFVKRT